MQPHGALQDRRRRDREDAAGGEINCLDPGGFGAVTITKAMTISCPYAEGGALAGGNGGGVNAQPTDVDYLRGLDIFGVNPPTNGISFIAGGAFHIKNCTIRCFNAANSFGVSFQPGGGEAGRATFANSRSGVERIVLHSIAEFYLRSGKPPQFEPLPRNKLDRRATSRSSGFEDMALESTRFPLQDVIAPSP